MAAVAFAVRPSQDARPEVLRVDVVRRFEHDRNAYCQGLVIDQGVLYESTGTYGGSSLRRVDLDTGRVLQVKALHPRLFGEGITVWQDRIIQLTWQSQTGIIYDKRTFDELGRFTYEGEGWGLTHNGEELIMSDGSETLRFLDPDTMKVTRRLRVHSRGKPVKKLNELEFVDGEILANVWKKDYIVRISPQSGAVTGVINLAGIYPRRGGEDVLNGIAFDADQRRLFVTGKNWRYLFEIRLLP